MIVFILGQNYSLLYIKFNFNILIRLFKKCPKKYPSKFLSNTLHHNIGMHQIPRQADAFAVTSHKTRYPKDVPKIPIQELQQTTFTYSIPF